MTININTSLPIIFIFGLLIVTVGYFIVEIFGGKGYFWREHLEKYNNSLFDRILHYVIRGIVVNLAILGFELFCKGGQSILIELLNNSGNMSLGIIGKNIDRTGIQIIVFSLFYFIYLIAVIFLFWCGKQIIKIFSWIQGIISKKYQSIKRNRI